MKIGIIGAIDEELSKLKLEIRSLKVEKIGELVFYTGILKGKDIILVKSGVGKVNASICTTLLISYFHVSKIIFTGVAGGVNPKINFGDIVISTDLIQHDFDTTASGGSYGVIPRMDISIFKADDSMVDLAKKIAYKEFGENRVWLGRILSGDQLIGSSDKVKWLRDTFDGECTEMEGAAVGHVCHLLNTPFVILRSISDKANENLVKDAVSFTQLAANNSKILIEKIVEKL